MKRTINLSFQKLAIITIVIAFIVSVVLTVNMEEAEGVASKTENKGVSVHVAGVKK